MTNHLRGSHYLDLEQLPWQPTRFPGIELKLLWQAADGEAFTAMYRLAPGAKLPKHRHGGVEQTFVLEGSLVDEDGECTVGNFVWREAGSVHAAHAPNGCVALGVFQRANQFLEEDAP